MLAKGLDDPTLILAAAAKQCHEQVMFALWHQQWHTTNAGAKQQMLGPFTKLAMPWATDICSSNLAGFLSSWDMLGSFCIVSWHFLIARITTYYNLAMDLTHNGDGVPMAWWQCRWFLCVDMHHPRHWCKLWEYCVLIPTLTPPFCTLRTTFPPPMRVTYCPVPILTLINGFVGVTLL